MEWKRLLGETRVVELPTPVCDSADCVHGAHCRGEQDPRVSTGASDQEEVINWGLGQTPERVHSWLQDGSQFGSASNSLGQISRSTKGEKEKVRHIQWCQEEDKD